MRRSTLPPVFLYASGGFLAGLLMVRVLHISAVAVELTSPGAIGQTQSDPKTQDNRRVFGSDAALVLNFVKADKAADFEAVMGKLKEALQKSTNRERQQQARSWKIFRALEPGGNGSILYLFSIDPAVHGADYTVSTILAEAFPDEVQSLYRQYADSYASGQNFVNLAVVPAFGREVVP